MTAQTCPRRMLECGPWERLPGLDRWEFGRWLLSREEAAAKHAAEDAKLHPNTTVRRGENNDLWLWEPPAPRTCSFCGSINPEDAFKLLSAGWEIEIAKSYKAYIQPPGSRLRDQAFVASCRDPEREPGQGVPSVWSPTPPVKLYAAHLTDEEIEKLNALLPKRT